MGQGAQSRALRLANLTQYGFDSQVIYDQMTGKPVGSVMPFDTAPDLFNRSGTGRMPGGAAMAWPDGYEAGGALSASVPWNTPDLSREDDGSKGRRGGSDPFPGMDGGR